MAVDVTFLLLASSYAASIATNAAAEHLLLSSSKRLFAAARAIFHNGSATADPVQVEPPPQHQLLELSDEAHALLDSRPVLRRAQLIAPLLRAPRLLWVDDEPDNNLYERSFFESLAIQIDRATSTEAAVTLLDNFDYHAVISDIGRGIDDRAGLSMLTTFAEMGVTYPVIYYVGPSGFDPQPPRGAFAICCLPDDLIHYTLDALERRCL